jgi:hypothetical protein
MRRLQLLLQRRLLLLLLLLLHQQLQYHLCHHIDHHMQQEVRRLLWGRRQYAGIQKDVRKVDLRIAMLLLLLISFWN